VNRVIDADAGAEIRDLEARFGPSRVEEHLIPAFRVGQWHPQGSEVCMVIRRPSGNLLTMIKTFYPRGAHRLPTGGIDVGEGILAAALRETHEETGLEVEVRRLLCRVAYRRESASSSAPVFHTFAFLLDERAGILGSLDPHEQLEEFREVDPRELRAIAARLEAIRGDTATEPGDWQAWGRFRAVVHRAVAEALGA
jgi:8-oxo-dGTP pyrophosphatase MutT (NUDIX family)